MAKVSPRTLSGFMELLPEQQMKMERMMEILRQSYSVYGFTFVIGSVELRMLR